MGRIALEVVSNIDLSKIATMGIANLRLIGQHRRQFCEAPHNCGRCRSAHALPENDVAVNIDDRNGKPHLGGCGLRVDAVRNILREGQRIQRRCPFDDFGAEEDSRSGASGAPASVAGLPQIGFQAIFCGAVRKVVGIRLALSPGNTKLSFQAARSIG
ncbi:hypothetical protein [Bradyrhizobium sp.]|jgi:hypothetical protein|uniref:hypothetical protein n=1 Tax=Bradyrhizobium sp. TaxID=376 RepID=UPI003D09F936